MTTSADADGFDRGLVELATLQWAALYKHALLLARYPVNTLAQVATVYLFFAMAFYGGKAAVGGISAPSGALTATFDGIIVGWFLWTMSIRAYLQLSNGVSLEAQWGTLEQLYMSPFGFGTVMAANVVSYLVESLVWGGTILALMLVTTGRTLAVDLVTVVPLSLLAVVSVIGIGFTFAGLALIYKRISNLSQLMQFVLIGLIAAPVAGVPWLRLLPLVQGSAMLQRAMRDGVRLWEFPASDLALLVGVAAAHVLAGYLVFRWCARVAQRRGVMGHY